MVRNGKSFHLHSPYLDTQNCKNCFSLGSLRTPWLQSWWSLAWSQRNYDIMEGSSQGIGQSIKNHWDGEFILEEKESLNFYSVEFFTTYYWLTVSLWVTRPRTLLLSLLTKPCHKFLSVVRPFKQHKFWKCKCSGSFSSSNTSKQWLNPPHCYLIIETLSQDAKLSYAIVYWYFTHT